MIDDEDIVFTDLSISQDTIILDKTIEYLKLHGPTPINVISEILMKDSDFTRSIIKSTILDACDHNLIICSKKVNKILGEYLISLK